MRSVAVTVIDFEDRAAASALRAAASALRKTRAAPLTLGLARSVSRLLGSSSPRPLRLRPMSLAATFQQILDSLPDDWTDLEFDLRIADESRYVDAALYLATCNAQPYSRHDWHWRVLVAHRFGHAASAPTVHGTLRLLDDAGIEGELRVVELRSGRVEVTQMWGRPHSVREEFRQLRAQ
jgi:hypothetical protein